MEVIPFVRLGLVMIRPGALMFAVPLFGGLYVPPQVRIGLTLLVGIVIAPVVSLPVGEISVSFVAAREIVIGTALGMAVTAVFAAAELGGYLVGFQAGFGMAAVIDPQSGVRNNLVATLYGLLTLFTFFLIDGHHTVLRALVESYATLPIGSGELGSSLVGAVTALFGLVFTVGFQLAVPVIVTLLVVELALGLVARSAPAMNLMVIGFPARGIAALFTLAVTVGLIPIIIRSVSLPALRLAADLASAFE